jgi:hypothetical protein
MAVEQKGMVTKQVVVLYPGNYVNPRCCHKVAFILLQLRFSYDQLSHPD